MIPIRDYNPTRRKAAITFLLVAANVAIFAFLQPDSTSTSGQAASIEFTYEYAAIPCEVLEGRPLSIGEVEATLRGSSESCLSDAELASLGAVRSQPVFPDKQVLAAVLFSMFFHGSWLHLGGNMLYLWIFGNNIEDHLGWFRYAIFYVLGGVVATVAHVAVNPDSTVPLVGASGAVAAVMGAYLVWFPNAPVRTLLMFFIITFTDIRAKWLLGIWFVSQFFIQPDAGVAWMAHVGGFAFGAAIAALVRSSRWAVRAMWRRDQEDPWHRAWPGGVEPKPWDEPPGFRGFR